MMVHQVRRSCQGPEVVAATSITEEEEKQQVSNQNIIVNLL
jgi:hypothetical protein